MNLLSGSSNVDALYNASFIVLSLLSILMFINVGLYVDESNFLFGMCLAT